MTWIFIIYWILNYINYYINYYLSLLWLYSIKWILNYIKYIEYLIILIIIIIIIYHCYDYIQYVYIEFSGGFLFFQEILVVWSISSHPTLWRASITFQSIWNQVKSPSIWNITTPFWISKRTRSRSASLSTPAIITTKTSSVIFNNLNHSHNSNIK